MFDVFSRDVVTNIDNLDIKVIFQFTLGSNNMISIVVPELL